jgi:hypothetical protein
MDMHPMRMPAIRFAPDTLAPAPRRARRGSVIWCVTTGMDA